MNQTVETALRWLLEGSPEAIETGIEPFGIVDVLAFILMPVVLVAIGLCLASQ